MRTAWLAPSKAINPAYRQKRGGVGNAAGTAAVAGVGTSTALPPSPFSAAGTATVLGVGSAAFGAVGSSDGQAFVAAESAGPGVATAAGVGEALGIGYQAGAGVVAAAGVATAAAVAALGGYWPDPYYAEPYWVYTYYPKDR